jgi:hypothetical protein
VTRVAGAVVIGTSRSSDTMACTTLFVVPPVAVRFRGDLFRRE